MGALGSFLFDFTARFGHTFVTVKKMTRLEMVSQQDLISKPETIPVRQNSFISVFYVSTPYTSSTRLLAELQSLDSHYYSTLLVMK